MALFGRIILAPNVSNLGNNDVIDVPQLIDSSSAGIVNGAEDDDLPVEGGVLTIRHLLSLSRRGQFNAASDLAAQLHPDKSLSRDANKRTATHYAARSPHGAETLKLIIQHAGYRTLKVADWDRVTPLHLAAARQSAEDLRSILSSIPKAEDYLAKRDKFGNTVPHYAASNVEHKDVIHAMVDIAGAQCLAWQNAKGQAVLHLAVVNAPLTEVQPLLDWAGLKCQSLRDNDGNTWAHYVAKRSDSDSSAHKLLGSQELLATQNLLNESVLHRVLKYCSHAVAKQLIKVAGPTLISFRDIYGNTCAHYAAMRDNNDELIDEIVRIAGPTCLRMRNVRGELVWHLVLKNSRFETVSSLMALMQEWGMGVPDSADADGNKSAHYATLKVDSDRKILALVQRKNADCLRSRNKRGQSVLHLVVRHCSIETAVQLVRQAKPAIVELQDEDGNTCLHYAAQCERYEVIEATASRLIESNCWLWTNKHNQTVMHLAIRHESSRAFIGKSLTRKIVGIADASDRNMLFYACTGWNYGGLRIHRNDSEKAAKEFRQLDVDKNTLAHAVFLNDNTEQSADDFFATLDTVIEAGVDKRAENNLGQTCLHSSVIDASIFADILVKAAADSQQKSRFRKFLTNSNGVHAVHAFAGRYRLRDLAQPLAELSDMQVAEMLQLTVAKGPNKGATSLHFACEAGHEENIQYLMNCGLRLAEKTHQGQSCIDFGYDKGKMDIISGLPGVDSIDLLRLIDPVNRSLKLPDRSTARHLLASISDESMRATIQRDTGMRTIANVRVTTDANGDETRSRIDLKILLRAVQLDSPKILRSGLRLGLISPRTENNFRELIRQQFKIGNSHAKLDGFSQNKLDDFFRMHRLKDDETSEMLILEFCLHFEKLEILPDLILTRQFQLIPACVSLLIQMRPNISRKKGRHEQLRRLHSTIVCIVVNAFDELFVNADQSQKELLFKYIRGDMKNKDLCGPRFPSTPLQDASCCCPMTPRRPSCACSNESDSSEASSHRTLFELIREADCDDIFATDCMYELVKQEWEGRSTMEKNESTPKTKFYRHLFGFGLFLIYFTWYIIDFKTTFANIGPDIVLLLYTLSLTAHELNDFFRSQRKRRCHSRRCRLICTSCPEYFLEILNYFDCLALLFMWIGVVWKLAIYNNASHPTVYACQMILSTSYLLWGFRSVSFLTYSEHIGPVITMLEHLLIRDLLPFLAIILVIVYSFGVFFFNLLFPVATAPASETSSDSYGVDVFVQVYTMPLKLLFSDFPQNLAAAQAGNQSINGEAAHPTGYPVFEHFARYTFLLVCNLVMLNLLIALFNLRVSNMSSKARGIWRRSYFRMLLEYKRSGPVPPPLSFVYYAYRLVRRCHKCRRSNREVADDPESKHWWLKESAYPEEYTRFLQFQAAHFRRSRPGLSRHLEANRSDADSLKSHTRNALAELHTELDDALARQLARLQKLEDQRADDLQTLRRLARRRGAAGGPERVNDASSSRRLQAVEERIDRICELLERR